MPLYRAALNCCGAVVIPQRDNYFLRVGCGDKPIIGLHGVTSHTPGRQRATRGKRSQSVPPDEPLFTGWPCIKAAYAIQGVGPREYLHCTETNKKYQDKISRAGHWLTQSQVSSDYTVVKIKSVYWIAGAYSLPLLFCLISPQNAKGGFPYYNTAFLGPYVR